ncbi:MAG TPA: hypothetical protein P5531_09530 [Bacteroidales bacterium]|nr:hypothetical protein [Bacteroidales bacterium]HSA43876.1 hypothetical protein [Bacteroidales bacterium]
MQSNRRILYFLIKALIICLVLALPVTSFDDAYGKFYRSLNTKMLGKIQSDGFVRYSPGKKAALTHINIWNQKQVKPNGRVDSAKADVNTRYRGYLPTVLLIALVLASPVPWRRRLLALFAGFTLVTLLVLFKAWLGIVEICRENQWLDLVHYAGFSNWLFELTSRIFFQSTGTVFYFVVAIWVLVTFRKNDLQKMGMLIPAAGIKTKQPDLREGIRINKTKDNKKLGKSGR